MRDLGEQCGKPLDQNAEAAFFRHGLARGAIVGHRAFAAQAKKPLWPFARKLRGL